MGIYLGAALEAQAAIESLPPQGPVCPLIWASKSLFWSPLSDLPLQPCGIGRREVQIMNQEQNNSLLSIDIQIKIRAKAYRIQVKDALKWIVPIAALIVRVIAELKRSHS